MSEIQFINFFIPWIPIIRVISFFQVMEHHEVNSGSYDIMLRDQFGAPITTQNFSCLMQKNRTCNCLTIELILTPKNDDLTPPELRMVIHANIITMVFIVYLIFIAFQILET